MLRNLLIFTSLIFTFSLSAQDWCKKNEPAKLDRPPGSFDNKLISDRFIHTINPNPVDYKSSQIEITTIFRPEYYQNGHWVQFDSVMHGYNTYNSYMLKHGFWKDLELQLCYTNLILNAGSDLREYSKESPNTGLSIGLKQLLYQSGNRKTHCGLYGQVTIPKLDAVTTTLFSPEIRILCSRQVAKHLKFTVNLGGAYIDKTQKAIIIYDFNLLRTIGDRFEIFTEFYKNYSKTGPARNASKRYLFGAGFYFYENLYCYSTFESGWANEDDINDFRIDLGITFRING
jgi:hypothetical protein